MEFLPTGRPCWVPGQSRTILFPAGDGQLYRCQLPAAQVEGGLSVAVADTSGQTSPVPVTWKIPIPGLGRVLLQEPVWSSDPRLRKWVIVGLGQQTRLRPRANFQSSKLWWLELNEQAESVLAAGRLTVPENNEADDDDLEERFPNLAVGPGGKVRLVYLARRRGQKSSELRSAELDAGTGPPRLTSGQVGTRKLGEGLGLAPPLVSADGRKVFALDDSGRTCAFSLVEKTD